MANMTTVLSEFTDNGNARTYTKSGHTVAKPQVVIQKRKVPADYSAVANDEISVVFGAVDGGGLTLSSKVALSVGIRRPANASSADVNAAVALFREIVASDNFANVVSGQAWLQ